ncbi:MAG TPA: chain length determinant protein tyrosine kinase EpsG [Rhodocyclaceae bacterium]|nr:chain length determinant protein tyrosine kinase EpsG [Rhodocyclaceae bacterium]
MRSRAREFDAEPNVLPLGSGMGPGEHEDSIGAILVAQGRITRTDIDRIMELQREEGWRFGQAAVRLGLINEGDLERALNRQYDLPDLVNANSNASLELVTAYQPFHRRAEELRGLLTQLMIHWFGTGRRVLTVVSPGAGEGRSYVAANLAVLFSQLGQRTLLVDADMRRPRQHRIFDVPDRIGLTTILAGRADTSAAVPVNGFSRLSLLPAGALPPNPLELLSRPVLGRLLKEFQGEYDVVLLDTPPARMYADAQSITFRAGSAMVVTRKNHTRVADSNRVIQELNDTGARVVGAVMNGF